MGKSERQDAVASAKVKSGQAPQRRFKDKKLENSDVFKLKVAAAKKVIYNNNEGSIREQYIDIEHVHLWHTVDSRGKEVDRCHSVFGHTHEMKLDIDQQTGEVRAICGPAIYTLPEITLHKKNDKQRVVECLDKHVHEVEYIRTDKVTIRVTNPEAAMVFDHLTREKSL